MPSILFSMALIPVKRALLVGISTPMEMGFACPFAQVQLKIQLAHQHRVATRFQNICRFVSHFAIRWPTIARVPPASRYLTLKSGLVLYLIECKGRSANHVRILIRVLRACCAWTPRVLKNALIISVAARLFVMSRNRSAPVMDNFVNHGTTPRPLDLKTSGCVRCRRLVAGEQH